MNSQPKISIITISFNTINTIEQTILSIVNQTYTNIEYIIIDGGSTDGTIDIIKKHSDKITYWITEPDKGIYDAMNKGIKKATGEWINFMNCGDWFYENNTIEKVIPYLDDKSQIIYGDVVYRMNFGNYIKEAESYKCLKTHMPFCHQSTFIKTSVHKENIFDISFKSSGDYNFFYQELQKGSVFKHMPIIVASYDGEIGVSKNRYAAMIENGRIWKVSEKKSWKLSLFKFYIKNQIKVFLLNILPSNILQKREKRIWDNRYKSI